MYGDRATISSGVLHSGNDLRRVVGICTAVLAREHVVDVPRYCRDLGREGSAADVEGCHGVAQRAEEFPGEAVLARDLSHDLH